MNTYIMKSPYIVIAILSMFLSTLSCCPTKYTTQVEKVHDSVLSERTTVHVRDSVYVHLTDTVKILQIGDTVYNDVIRWRVQYVERMSHDTIIVRDTIRIIEKVEVEKTVEKRLGIGIGWSALIMIIGLGLAIYGVRKATRQWTGFL